MLTQNTLLCAIILIWHTLMAWSGLARPGILPCLL